MRGQVDCCLCKTTADLRASAAKSYRSIAAARNLCSGSSWGRLTSTWTPFCGNLNLARILFGDKGH